ncbi:MAG: hypothetical protein NVV68_03710 [Dokdonella sp.]|nr:hypothetical protein [Dokdonella sp.]
MIVMDASGSAISCRWWNEKTSTYDVDHFDAAELTPASTSSGNGDPAAVAKMLVGKARTKD